MSDRDVTKTRRPVLFLPRHATSFSKMRMQCQVLVGSDDLRPVMVLADPRTYAYAESCSADGIEVLNLSALDGGGADPVVTAERCWEKLCARAPERWRGVLRHDRVAHGLAVGWWRRCRVVAGYAAQRQFWRGLLAAIDPAAVIMPGDRELGFVPPVLAAARDVGVPSVVSAINIPTLDSVAATRVGKARFAVTGLWPLLANLWAVWRHPGQVAESGHGRLLFSPGWLVGALQALGMLPHHPWTQGGGYSDYVLLDGPRKRRKFIALAAPEAKLRIVGDLAHDILYEAYARRADIRRQLCLHHGLDGDKPLYIFAVPIFAEHNILPWEKHLSALRAFMTSLSSHTTNVLLSLHPKSSIETYRSLVAEFGFRSADQPLANILPAGDVMICGNSSTVDWAILCRMPVIDLDYAGLEDSAFADCEAVIKVSRPDMLAATIVHCEQNVEHLRRAQDAIASDLAMFDGRCAERYCAFLNGLL